jgi:hypothetical protein
LRVSYVTSSTEGSPIYQRKAPHFLSWIIYGLGQRTIPH